jgi:hypothetical protein
MAESERAEAAKQKERFNEQMSGIMQLEEKLAQAHEVCRRALRPLCLMAV